MELPDAVAGRRRFLEWTEGCIDWSNPGKAGDGLPDGQSLQSTFRRGWYFGSETFRAKLLEKLGKQEDPSAERQNGYQGEQARDHGVAEAERIIAAAEKEFGLRREGWSDLTKGDWRKGLVAGLIRQRALVDNGWLAERLAMDARNAVSRIIRQARERATTDRTVRNATKKLRSAVNLL